MRCWARHCGREPVPMQRSFWSCRLATSMRAAVVCAAHQGRQLADLSTSCPYRYLTLPVDVAFGFRRQLRPGAARCDRPPSGIRACLSHVIVAREACLLPPASCVLAKFWEAGGFRNGSGSPLVAAPGSASCVAAPGSTSRSAANAPPLRVSSSRHLGCSLCSSRWRVYNRTRWEQWLG